MEVPQGIIKGVSGYTAIVYIDGDTILAEDYKGSTIASGTAGKDDATVIQAAIDSLTEGRTWKEKVVAVGRFSVASPIKILDYITFEIQGTITVADGANINIIESASLSDVSFSCEIYGGTLDGNKTNNLTNGNGIYGIFARTHIHDITIQNCRDNAVHFTGVDWGNNRTSGTVILNSIISDNEKGIRFGQYCADNRVTNNLIRNNGNESLLFEAAPNTVSGGNHIWSSINGSQLLVCRPVGSSATGMCILGNFFDYVKREAIVFDAQAPTNIVRSLISNNIFQKVGTEANNTYDVIRLTGSGGYKPYYIDISHNMMYSYETNLPRNGVRIDAGSNIKISNNMIYHTASDKIMDNGSNTVIQNNIGYTTENSGTATIANGTTSIAVNHGLDVTPSDGDITVTPTGAWGTMTEFWVGNYTSTQFTIYADQDPGQDVTFAWRAVVL